jgi:hypothetical protein
MHNKHADRQSAVNWKRDVTTWPYCFITLRFLVQVNRTKREFISGVLGNLECLSVRPPAFRVFHLLIPTTDFDAQVRTLFKDAVSTSVPHSHLVRDVVSVPRGGQSSRQVKFINICVLLHHDHHYHHRIISPPSVTHKKAIRPAAWCGPVPMCALVGCQRYFSAGSYQTETSSPNGDKHAHTPYLS